MSEKKLPEPLYGCAICYCDYSWTASDLFWSDAIEGWCCDHCWDDIDEHWSGDDVVDRGTSLADELKRRGLNR